MRLPIFAGCLAMLVTAPAAAAITPPAPEPLVDRFMHALPHQEEYDAPAQVDAQRLAQLVAFNPGHEPELRTILLAEAACAAPAIREATRAAIRTIARNLGEAKLSRLIAFYEGPDEQVFERLTDPQDKGRPPSDADRKEMARLEAAYPLADWLDGMRNNFGIMRENRTFTLTIRKCSAASDAALARAKLRSR